MEERNHVADLKEAEQEEGVKSWYRTKKRPCKACIATAMIVGFSVVVFMLLFSMYQQA